MRKKPTALWPYHHWVSASWTPANSGVALDPEERDRHRQIVDDVQHRDGDDERQIEPVGDVDVRLAPAHDRAEEDDQVDHPDERQPEVDVPLRLGVLAALGDAEHVAGGGEHDEQLIAPEQERGERRPAEQRRPAGALDHVERGAEQRVAAEGEDRGRGVDRPQAAEGGPLQAQIEHRVGELEGDERAHGERDHAPEHGRDGEPADDVVVVGLPWASMSAARGHGTLPLDCGQAGGAQ